MSVIDNLKDKIYKKPDVKFNYDALLAPPLQNLIRNPNDIVYLYNLVTDIRYRSKSQYKYDEIGKVMEYNGFKKLHAGTNRLVYKHMEIPDIVAKIPYRKVALEDNLQEYHNQNFIKPYCTKTFEVHPSGIIAISERVTPLTHRDEMYNVKELILMMLSSLLANGLIFDDLGSKFFRNYGYRKNFGPVFIDYPTIYEVDSRKLYCKKQYINGETCGGELVFDAGLNQLKCDKCGIEYSGRDVGIPLFKAIQNNGIIMYDKEDVKMKVTFYRDNKVESEVVASSNTIKSDALDEALMKVSLSRPMNNDVVEKESSTVKSVEDVSNGNTIEVEQTSESEFKVISKMETKNIPKVINLYGYGLYKLIEGKEEKNPSEKKGEILEQESIEEPVDLEESDFPTKDDFDETGRFILEGEYGYDDERDV